MLLLKANKTVSKGKPDRVSLKQYYKEKNYDDSYFILQGMTSSEVDRIDESDR